MKKLIYIAFITTISFNLYSQSQKGKSSVGYSGGYGFESKNPTLTFDYRYNFSKYIRAVPSVTRMGGKYGFKGWMADANIHYIFPVHELFNTYLLAGGSYSYWHYKDKKTKKYTPGESYYGGNAGLGAEIFVIEEIVIGIEARYNLIKEHKQVLLALRVGFNF